MKIERFEDLDIWKEARLLNRKIFELTRNGPFVKDFKLKAQILSSSGSIMDNIAEGFERAGNKEFIQFLSIAKGSCGECRSQIHRALDYRYIDDESFLQLNNMSIAVSRKISNLITYLKNSELKGYKFKS
jgi:four helix bundle protein